MRDRETHPGAPPDSALRARPLSALEDLEQLRRELDRAAGEAAVVTRKDDRFDSQRPGQSKAALVRQLAL